MQGIEHLSIGAVSTGVILLSGLFFYDIFWVFCTPVMVSVVSAPSHMLYLKLDDSFSTYLHYCTEAWFIVEQLMVIKRCNLQYASVLWALHCCDGASQVEKIKLRHSCICQCLTSLVLHQ